MKKFDKIYKFVFLIIGSIILYEIYTLKSYLKTNKVSEKKSNIFFIETNTNREIFSLRQLCAIESAAKHNLNSIINVYSAKAKINNRWLDKYPNIKMHALDIDEIIKDTILEKWFNSNKKKIKSGNYYLSHLSDILRYALLWKNGGFYSDLDTISVKSIEKILKYNAIILENDDPIQGKELFFNKINKKLIKSTILKHIVNGANLFFGKNHPFIHMTMIELTKVYKHEIWSVIGPNLLQKMIKKYCKEENLNNLVLDLVNFNKSLKSNCDVKLFPSKLFSPVNWPDWKSLFRRDQSVDIAKFKHVYSIHFYSKMSEKEEISINSNNVFEFYAINNCPLIFESL